MSTLTHNQEDIATRAYFLYLEGGCQDGRDVEYWLQAEKEIGSRFFTPPADAKAMQIAKKPAPKKVPAAIVAAPAAAETPKPTVKKATAKKAAEAPAKKPAAKKKA